MLSLLGHHVNRRIAVSLPVLLGNADPLICVLVSCEAAGIWVSSPELSKKLCPRELAGHMPQIFVPYAQIGFVTSAESPQPHPPSGHSASAPPDEPPKSHRSKRKRD